jgi:predicted lipoprotein with Yx(FWY)xxD motif
MRKLLLLAVLFAASTTCLFAAAALGTSSSRNSTRATSVRIATRRLPKLGVVLVNAKGRTLYMFVPDKRSKVTCVKSCAVVWPPVKLTSGERVVAAGQAKASLLRSDRNPSGGRVVTYNGWPLYAYVADTAAGQAKGQALNLNGGYWYVLSPAGKVIKTKL